MSSAAAPPPPPQTLAECLKSAGGGGSGGGEGGEGGDRGLLDDDLGAAAAEVSAWLVERVSSFSDASPSPSSSASLASLIDEVASSLASQGSDARVLDAGVFDWAPKVLGAADGGGEAGKEKNNVDGDDVDRDRAPSTSSSSSSSPSAVAAAVHRLASAMAAHLSPREALALFSAEMASAHGQKRLSPKQVALLSALPLALSRLGNTRARLPAATGALSAATSAVIRALSAGAAAAAAATVAAEGAKGTSNSSSSNDSAHAFVSTCQSAAEFASALPAVAQAWAGEPQQKGGEEEATGERARARSLLASSLLRLLPAACLPFAPLCPPAPSALGLLRPQTASALRRGEERALGSPEKRRAAEAAGAVAVAVVSALCSLSFACGGEAEGTRSETASPPSFENSWGFSVETSAPPPQKKKSENKKKKGVGSGDSDSGDDSSSDSDEEEEEGEGQGQGAAAVGRTPSALSLSLATYASAWCSSEKGGGGSGAAATEKGGETRLSLASAAATASSRSLSAAAASVPPLLDEAFARRSPGLVVAAAQLASVSAASEAAEAAAKAAEAPPSPRSTSTAGQQARSSRTLLSHLARAMSLVPSSAARNACYEAWEATLRAMPVAERVAECARLADEAAAPGAAAGRAAAAARPSSFPSSLPPSGAPNAAVEALALHHLSSLVASSWPKPASAKEEEDKRQKASREEDGFVAAAAALASAATDRLFPLNSRSPYLGWGGSEVSLLERVEPVAASLAALRLLLGRSRTAPLLPSVASRLPAPLAALVSAAAEQRRWRRRSLVGEALLPLRAAASSAAAGLRAAAGDAGRECAGGGSEAGLAVERLLDALARVLELAEAA